MFLGYQNGKIKFYTENELDKELYNLEKIEETDKEYVLDGDEYVLKNTKWKRKQKEKRKNEFHEAFFNTSLGYVRRSVTMANGSKKDFLTDLLPVISLGFSSGQQVNIITYNEPDFEEDIIDWTPYQRREAVTQQFLNECFVQLSNDFLPEN